jgi:hypothetical protein
MTEEADTRMDACRGVWWRIAAMLFVVGFIVQLNSERAYWFFSPEWFTSSLGETLGVAAFYGFAVAGALWALGRVPGRGLHQVVLAGVIFGWTVEGVIVYVLHEAGPFDLVFPAMFAGWHGLLSFVGLFYLVRRWLLQRRIAQLAAAAAGYGTVWGTWAITSWLPNSDDMVADSAVGGGSPASPAEFAVLAVLFVAALGVAHLILDRVWPHNWRPGPLAGWLILGVTGVYAALAFLAIPWAPLRWVALVAVPVAGLVRSGGGTGPNLYAAMQGRVHARDLVALVPIAVIAAGVYAAAWAADPNDAFLEVVMAVHVLAQVGFGGTALVWSMVRALRTPPVLPEAASRREPAVAADER